MPNPKISIILPCLNEARAIGSCLDSIAEVIKKNKLSAEIIIVDNGSKDNSSAIVKERSLKINKVRLIHEYERGYGAAYLKGFKAAKGKYLFLADSDGSYDFNEIPRFIEALGRGYDFVIGNRFRGRIEKNAMSWSHKYIGNPLLSGILRFFFKAKIHDAHCGMRAITRQALEKLNLRTTGMEFASEMIIKAIKKDLKILEVPIDYYKRKGTSKLKSFADAWRHLRFMLLYSPLFLFFIPGIFLFLIGLISMPFLYMGLEISGITFFYHPMFLSSLSIIMGYQLIIFALFAKTYTITHLGEEDKMMEKIYRQITIEKAGIVGMIIILLGVLIYMALFFGWLKTGFGALQEIRNSIIASTLIITGIQTIFSSFMLSILGIKEK